MPDFAARCGAAVALASSLAKTTTAPGVFSSTDLRGLPFKRIQESFE